jgi:Na+-driven multidrug efflux pump
LAPEAWLRLFGDDPQMIAVGSAYLRAVGPFYGFFGFGLALYFASQGAGKLLWPLLVGLARMIFAVGGGWIVLKLTGSLSWMFLVVGLALAIYGVGLGATVWMRVWFRNQPSAH